MSFLHDLPIADLIAHYGYLAIFVIITLESAGLPLPGETVLLTSAAYAGSTGNINIAVVVAIAATAAILGDNAGYWVGRRWGLPLLLRKGHLIGLDHGRLKLGQYLFRRHGGKIVFFGRFTAMLRAYAAVLAGVNKLDARRFFAFNALGGVAWASIMGFGAYLCGRSIENVMGPVGLGLLAFVLMGAVALWLFMRRHEARLMVAAEAAIPGPLAERLDEARPQVEPTPGNGGLDPNSPIQADFQNQIGAPGAAGARGAAARRASGPPDPPRALAPVVQDPRAPRRRRRRYDGDLVARRRHRWPLRTAHRAYRDPRHRPDPRRPRRPPARDRSPAPASAGRSCSRRRRRLRGGGVRDRRAAGQDGGPNRRSMRCSMSRGGGAASSSGGLTGPGGDRTAGRNPTGALPSRRPPAESSDGCVPETRRAP
jgi:membrane protein DedA with SNARE-associated domain